MTANHARVLMTGSRRGTDRQRIEDALVLAWHEALETGHAGIIVVHGAAPGADTYADQWARAREADGVQRDPHPADWETCAPNCPPPAGHRRLRADGTEYCPTAGHRRNQLMVDLGASLCIAFPVGKASGTYDCMGRARRAGITVWEVAP